AGVLSLAGGLALDQGVPWAAWLALAVLAGYVSHLVLDLANPTPELLLWPWSRKRIRLTCIPALPEGGLAENALEALVACLALAGAWAALGPDTLSHLREVVRP
ncbi:MAG: metal-dependent hydrolase, partial [Firmicutes bacterium]|nr:metal-dependent hydrolase [Bacillota bacterium]